jgi:hypothetical protein
LNRVRNKALHPTIVPQTLKELIIEHAIARESIRLAFAAHQSLTVTPVPRYLDIANWANHGRWSDTLLPKEEKSYLDMKRIQWIVGTGGLLSHSPRRSQAALVLLDAFQPAGVTGLAQDSVFMIPHLGVLSTVNDKAAVEIFHRDCLIRLGTCIAFTGKGEEGSIVGTISMRLPDGSTMRKDVIYGELSRVSLGSGAVSEVEISPRNGFDAGKGPGRELKTNVEGGEIGVLIDARGRPLQLSEDDDERRGMLLKWYKELDVYPTNTDLENGE